MFNAGYKPSMTGRLQSAPPQVTATAARDASKGVQVSDSVNAVSFTMAPKFQLQPGEQDGNRIVYPLMDNSGWLVESMHAVGVKEDIVLSHATNDKLQFHYTLGLNDGLQARVQDDGSIGVFGSNLLSGEVSTGNAKDAALLQKARQNIPKNTLMFTVPAPVIKEADGHGPAAKAHFELHGNELTVSVENLWKARYPLTIDPSIYVATAQQFMHGNNETNIDFDVADGLIQKGKTTGARFDSWDPTLSLNTTTWRQGAAVAGGYIYTVGGVHPDGGSYSYTTPGSDTFVVPDAVNSITVKLWGGGGGGGGGGRSNNGGDGGGAGYALTTLSVTPGETLNITVGGGGGAGGGSGNSGAGGGGGGYSRIARGSTSLIVAPGGGGGGGGGRTSGYTGGSGGAGGGTTGTDGGDTTAGGGSGGTASSGGSGGTGGNNNGSNGGSLYGGDGGDGRNNQGSDGGANNGGSSGGGAGGNRDVTNRYAGGGGGGAGYYGGGGGSGSDQNDSGGGGGGGSGYTTGTGAVKTAGSGNTPGNSSDPDRNTAGQGGNGGNNRNDGSGGNSGIVLIGYAGSTNAQNSVDWAKFNTSTGDIEYANPGSGTCSGWCSSSAYYLPAGRGNFSLVAYNGFLYAIGGEDTSCTSASGTGDSTVCKTVYIAKLGANGEPRLWHPTDTNKANWTYWYRDTNLSIPRSYTSAFAYNNRMYLVGGQTSSGGTRSVTSSSQVADITATGTLGSWSNTTALPYAVYGHNLQAYNDRLYLIGGASSIGGAPLSSVYYAVINSDGTLNSWIQTSSLTGPRMSQGGNNTTVWGGYIYLSGGCSAVNASGYCTNVSANTQLASINADGSLDVWYNNTIVSDARMGQNIVAWRNYIYQIGGCTDQDGTTGGCNTALSSINFGKINGDGDASTVAQSVSSGSGDCTGSTPTNCDLPGTSYIGNMLTEGAVVNGYLYVIGGCTNNSCSSTTGNVAYAAISSTGSLTKPASCNGGSYQGGMWCVDTTHTISGGVAAARAVVFGGRIYVVGGLDGGGNTNSIQRIGIDSDGSLSASGWTSQSMTGVGATSVSYTFAYSRANPASASTNPGNLYIFGGCTASNQAGCTSYSDAVYKCNIQASGAVASCSTSGQLQIGVIPGDTQPGLGIMCGTVYAGYIYLIGGVSPTQTDLSTVRYAKFDNNNDVVASDGGSSWIESPNETEVGRRRGSAFGYNGYIYVAGGYDGTSGSGVLADIEFAKVNVSDGSIGTFQTSAVTINQRWGLSIPVSNSFAYVIGGCTNGASPGGCSTRTDTIQTFQIYNNDSGSPAGYSDSAHLFSGDRVGGSATIHNGYIYVAGGCQGTSDCTGRTNNVQSAPIDASGNVGTWSATASLPANRSYGKLESAGGSLYYIGGSEAANGSCGTQSGKALFQKWDGISGTDVASLYSDPGYPASPDSTQTITGSTLSGPVNIDDNYGGKLSALLCAPQTGNYSFWVSSDDNSELKISSDSSSGNVGSSIASVSGWTSTNEWTKYTSQHSGTVYLQAGHQYYIEAN